MKKRMMLIGMVAAMLSIAAPAYAQDSTEPAPPDKGVKPVGLYISEVRLTAGGKVVEAAPPGEPVTARLTAVNQGDKAVHNVVLTVGKAPEGLRVIDGTANFGDIAAGADATANISFEASLKGCQDGLGLEATFSYSNGDEPTGFGFAIACPGPRLFVDNARYEGGDGDQVPEPGETLKVFLTLRNEGRDTATDVRGVYHLLSGKVRIIDDSATWPDIAPQKTGTNETPLVIEIAKDADVAQSCMGAIQTGPPVGVDDKGAPPQDGGTVTPDGGTVSSDGSAGGDSPSWPACPSGWPRRSASPSGLPCRCKRCASRCSSRCSACTGTSASTSTRAAIPVRSPTPPTGSSCSGWPGSSPAARSRWPCRGARCPAAP